MDVNTISTFIILFQMLIPIAIIIFIVKSLANQRQIKYEIQKLNDRVDELSKK